MFAIFRKSLGWVVFFVAYSIISVAHASKEGILAFSSFSMESRGIGLSGPIRVTGTQVDDRIVSFQVAAFGRQVVLNAPQLYQLREFPVNGMQLSYEDGWGEDNRVLYITISKGFSDGIEEKKLIQIDSRGSVNIR